MSKAKPKPKKKSCDCLKHVNEEARKRGFVYATSLTFNFETQTAGVGGPFLMLEKVDGAKKGRMPMAACAYCPFCGKKKL